jgi:predicted helicase
MMQLYPYQQRALNAIQKAIKGTCYLPTGAGKTVVMMEDTKQRILNALEPMTFVVVAPRILLANQLCSEFEEYLKGHNVAYMHAHSGETTHQSSTRPADIAEYNDTAIGSGKHHIIFTTYNSIGRVNEAELNVDVVFFDEAHHCTKPSNFVGVAHTSAVADNAYFFTATPKFNNSKESMNNTDVYGSNIISIPAQELIEAGSIIPPRVVPYEAQTIRTKENAPFVDAENIVGILSQISDCDAPKVLVAAPSTKVIWAMFTESDLLQQLNEMGYTIMHITSKHGAYIDKKKVSREVFFDTMNAFGADPDKKFIVFHYSIMSEGISIHGLTHCIMLRNLPLIEMAQTVGRIIRVHNNYGDKIARQLQNVIDTIFVKGEVLAA